MGYNKEDFAKIKAEYTNKYFTAKSDAERRRRELHERLPAVRDIDMQLAGTGRAIMNIILTGKGDTEVRIAELKEHNLALAARRGELLLEAGYPADYSDMHYECDKCDDMGYTDGRMCECMKRALVLAGYESSGLGALIRTQSFDNFSLEYYKNGGNYDMMQMYSTGLRNFAEGFDKNTYKNYLLIGGTGLGKTHLSTAVAKEVINRGFDVFYVTAVGMFNQFENKQFGDGERAKNIDRYYDSDLLIIDDLGTELVNQFTQSYLYDVINTRINNRKCTFINTNLNKKEIEAKYNERVASRLFGEYFPILFMGTDIRMQKRKG